LMSGAVQIDIPLDAVNGVELQKHAWGNGDVGDILT